MAAICVCDITNPAPGRAIRERELLLRQLVTKADGIVIIGQDHQVIEANNVLRKCWEYTHEKYPISIHGIGKLSPLKKKCENSLAFIQGGHETKHRRKDGTIFDVEVSARDSFKGKNEKYNAVMHLS